MNNVNIFKGNSFKYHYVLPLKPKKCFYKNEYYLCKFLNKNNKTECSASIYNGSKHFPIKPKYKYNIIITTEKLSQVKFMKEIGDGKSKYYHLAIDYRLFNNKWHISKPHYSKMKLIDFISIAKKNYGSFTNFIKRKNRLVYIQKVSYPKRQYIVKEIMKYFNVDSYGKDLNNIEWPKNVSKNDKIKILKEYKFCLAIENSVITWKYGKKFQAHKINNDYVTEKMLDCLKAGSIPVYFGAQNVDKFLPHPKSIINMNRFHDIFSLTQYIYKLINNTSILKEHLEWFYNYSTNWFNRFSNKFTFDYCKVCNYVVKYS